MNLNKSACPIWNTPALTKFSFNEYKSWWRSPRVCGQYILTSDGEGEIQNLEDYDRIKLTSWLTEQRRYGNSQPEITREVISEVKQRRTTRVNERADNILGYFESKSPVVGTIISISKFDVDVATLDDSEAQDKFAELFELLCLSESASNYDLGFLLQYLEKQSLIRIKRTDYPLELILTLEGYMRLDAIREVSTDSTKAFVAMWFDDSMTDAWAIGIQPAIIEAGYDPVRIDQKEHTNRIDDEIIAEIRRARFVVADFTHGKYGSDLLSENCGARGGVYYEAGFAHGLSIDVIFTCRKDMIEEIHFDTRQFNHITWSKPEDLKKALYNRISAVFGDGPLKPSGF